MRPQTLDEIIGQQHLLSTDGVLRRCAEKKTLFSRSFYGPPGIGKTTLAMVLANEAGLPYRLFNAVNEFQERPGRAICGSAFVPRSGRHHR